MSRRRGLVLLCLIVSLILVFPAFALGDSTPPDPARAVLPGLQLWAAVLGALTPLAGYVLNHYAPWATENVKAVVQVVLAAIVGAVYDLIAAGNFALDSAHLQIVFTAVVGALVAHNFLYKPGTINVALGGGTNSAGSQKPAAARRNVGPT